MPQDPAPGQPSGHVSLNQVKALFGLLLPLPPFWLAGVGLAAVLSLFQVTQTADGHMVFVMQVSTITAVFVALAWLPALLKVFALAGFDVKTAVGEASTNGLGDLLPLLDPGSRRAALPPMIAALEVSAPSMGSVE